MQKKIPVIPFYIAGAICGYLVKGRFVVESLYFHILVLIGLLWLEWVDYRRRKKYL